MAKDIISKKTRQLLREYFVGTCLREIDDEFDAADIAPDDEYVPPVSGARRSRVEQYYKTLNFSKWEDVRRFLEVCGSVLQRLEVQIANPPAFDDDGKASKESFEKLSNSLRRDGMNYAAGRVNPVGRPDPVEDVAARFDLPELHRQLDRMRTATHDDPRLAIGTAKELVETTCKTILAERSVSVEPAWTLPQLVRATQRELSLLPDDVPQAAKGAETIRRVLNSLASVVGGLGELRGLYGTGHGPDGRARGLGPRHARLAAGAAQALALFFLETHEERR